LKVGVIVPFYKGYKYLEKLTESIEKAANGYSCTLFIIDNSPENLPIESKTSINLPMVVIREKQGIGYGKACNVGYARCKQEGFDYIIVVNQDGYVSEGLMRGLLQPFEKDKSIMIVAPFLKTYEDEVEDFFIKFYLSQVPDMVSDMFAGHLKGYYEMVKISGACFAFSLRNEKYVFDYFFDPLYHMYCEDEDLCHRIHMLNGKVVLVNREVVFYHQHSHTTDIENQEIIHADKLVSEKILRLKDSKKRSAKALYGIFVTTFIGVFYHLFRGEFLKSYLHLRSLLIVLYKLPRILRSRRQDLLTSRAAGQNLHLAEISAGI
jgi:N-acetylglucosaminyl-diphospho-decaprenol L-rhamnosyltransferase